MTDERPEQQLRAVIVEAIDQQDWDVDAEADHLRELARRAPGLLVDGALDHLPSTTPVVPADLLVATTYPKGQPPLRSLPAVVWHAPDHVRIETHWEDDLYVFPIGWDDLVNAELLTGWEIRRRTYLTPEVELNTPYMVFSSPSYGILIALHPATISIIARGLATLMAR